MALVAFASIPAIANENFPFPGDAELRLAQQRHLCSVIETAARQHDLPVAFFTRLLWKESSFRPGAVSPKGAQGIAQFMPGTAEDRGLADPFDPLAAIPASAHLLSDLKAQFGNLGLAAAAYNAGAARVTAWIAGTSTLPTETQDYVLAITGEPAESWTAANGRRAALPGNDPNCVDFAAKRRPDAAATAFARMPTASGTWGVQVSGNYSQSLALADYSALQRRFPAIMAGKPPMIIRTRLGGRGMRIFYRIRVPAESRDAAGKLCSQLRDGGSPCIVLKT